MSVAVIISTHSAGPHRP